MRLSWGWYLNNPLGTESTCIEGYLQDGSFGYRGEAGYGGDYSYTSHAHGWSTGPTHALSNYVLGLQLTSPGGGAWILAPQFGDLRSVEGGYTTPLGKFSAKWALNGTKGYSLEYDIPRDTTGILILPTLSTGPPSVTINGERYNGGLYDWSTKLVTIDSQPGGAHAIVVVY